MIFIDKSEPVESHCPEGHPLHDRAFFNASIYGKMKAAGGIVFQSLSAAATAYPSLWKTPNAAYKADTRFCVNARGEKIKLPMPTQPVRETKSVRVDYQLAGRGRRPATAWYDPTMISNPKAAVEAMLGPLAKFRDYAAPASVELDGKRQ